MSTAVDFNESVTVVDVENIDSDTDSINCIDNSNGQPLLLPSSVTSSTVHILHNAEETPIVGTTISSRSVCSYRGTVDPNWQNSYHIKYTYCG